mgnify:FL=1
MPYSSDDDLLNEFSLTDLAKLSGEMTGTEINTDRTDYARSNADAIIDAYLYSRYDVPFSEPIDPIIKKISIDVTVANLFDYNYSRSAVPNTIVWRKLNAIKMLKDIQSGKVSLSIANPGTTAHPFILSNREDKKRIFSEELLNQMNIE